ncbi:hypothetical protein CQ018_03305 [Arthrobacter sp. MYb227]|uniref:DUF2332 domain-containing protein n=1 Tax=Arthrobacter sp. MYb227 TaxID=1848601 RepID=UPI000CFDF38C|nr:DUF2332 domain-containing protein [Arthrobacter sp. MYb227]PQZ96308.1 hypothetical protein CQ018_03305 [Arthrobacter sp. MYb227]
MSTEAAARIAEVYKEYAAHWFHGHSELYVRWADGVAGNRAILNLLASMPTAKQQPNLLFAAIRFLGSGDTEFEEAAAFIVQRWQQVRAVMLSHSTQTNEAGRCATLLPVFSMIAQQEQRPLALIEVGPSAGLCLLPDLYSYSYDGASPIGSGSPLLKCATSGNPPLPLSLPQLLWRAGVDLNPLDGTDPDTIRWLRALVWPGETSRLEQLDKALERLNDLKNGVIESAAGIPDLMTGDLNDRIASLVAAVPAGAVPVVFHSAVLAYLDPSARQRFATTVSGLDCHWVSNENFFMDLDGDTQQSSALGFFVLALNGVPLAHTGQHGAELHWMTQQAST